METAPHLSPLQVILSRHRLLEQVDNGVKDKRDLYDQLTVSRSTIDRAIRELEAENILRRRGSHCEFTRFGKLAYKQFGGISQTYKTLSNASKLLSALPERSELGMSLLHGSEVTLANQRAPATPFKDISSVPDGEPIQAMLPVLFPQQLQFLCQRVEKGNSIELIIHSDIIKIMEEKYESEYEKMDNHSVEINISSRLPQFGLIIVGSQKFLLSVHRENGGLHGLIENSKTDAVKKARQLFNQHQAGSKVHKLVKKSE
ncbi:GntR family transcriptional regulator [Halogeometricum borinquense]|uniref:GntR family transcriptional regulator n=1 Tax=Halogeometricum borinquense TaxID=60847 RepID=A0A6C0UJ80_9EURY|nr:GntR family transcriptional regulator [Halogeometricum borinquense]QIB75542.1 GntR family transcriptional regulator [Halogeometricum borinquense]